MKRISLMILVALVLVGCSAIVSLASVKTIKPNQLKPFNSNHVYEQCADYFRSLEGTVAEFTSEVKLPVGKTIRKFAYYHFGGTLASTAAFLYRTKMGEAHELVAIAFSSDTTSTIIPVEGEIHIPKIKSGYTYWIYGYSNNSNSYFKGIKIHYK